MGRNGEVRLAALAALLCLLSFSVRALDVQVTNTNDSGAGSLRDAIDQLNNGGGGTITFAANLPDADPNQPGKEIQITTTSNFSYGTSAFVISTNVGVVGPISIDGGTAGINLKGDSNNANNFKMFDVFTSLTLKNITIRDCRNVGFEGLDGGGSAAFGGAIAVWNVLTATRTDVTLTAINCSFVDNDVKGGLGRSSTNGGGGGLGSAGVLNFGGAPFVGGGAQAAGQGASGTQFGGGGGPSNGAVAGNGAFGGGGGSSGGFTGTTGGNGGFGGGGGGADSDSTAGLGGFGGGNGGNPGGGGGGGGFGGGIWAYNATVNLVNCTINGNDADGGATENGSEGSGVGGGIAALNSDVNLTHTIVFGNPNNNEFDVFVTTEATGVPAALVNTATLTTVNSVVGSLLLRENGGTLTVSAPGPNIVQVRTNLGTAGNVAVTGTAFSAPTELGLSAHGNNNGPVSTMNFGVLGFTPNPSPLIDAGVALTTVTADARGLSRSFDWDFNGVNAPDLGPLEVQQIIVEDIPSQTGTVGTPLTLNFTYYSDSGFPSGAGLGLNPKRASSDQTVLPNSAIVPGTISGSQTIPPTATNSVTITPAATGTTTVFLANKSFTLTVGGSGNPGGGNGGGNGMTGSDTDNDGFSDVLETAAGTNPNDATSTPFGGQSAGALVTLTTVKMGIKLNFSKSGSDSIKLSGDLARSTAINGVSTQLVVQVGDVAREFTLDDKGKAKAGNDSAQVKVNKKTPTTAKYSVKINKGSLSTALTASGLTNTTVKDSPVTIAVRIALDGTLFAKGQSQVYTAKAGKTGSTKDVR